MTTSPQQPDQGAHFMQKVEGSEKCLHGHKATDTDTGLAPWFCGEPGCEYYNPIGGTEEDAIDRLVDDFGTEAILAYGPTIEHSESEREFKKLKEQANAKIAVLLAEARKETVEALKPYLGTDLTVTGIAMLEKVLKSLTAQGGKSDE